MREEIVNCDFAFKCPQQWDKMTITEVDGVRFCGECEKNVYFANSQESWEQFSREGKCVAVLRKVSDDNLQNKFGLQTTAGIPAYAIEKTDENLPETDKTVKLGLLPHLIIGGSLAVIIIVTSLVFLALWYFLK